MVVTLIQILISHSTLVQTNVSQLKSFHDQPGMTIEDFGLHSDVHFESHLLENKLYAFSLFLRPVLTKLY